MAMRETRQTVEPALSGAAGKSPHRLDRAYRHRRVWLPVDLTRREDRASEN